VQTAPVPEETPPEEQKPAPEEEGKPNPGG
jgi:hypothetical protein